MKAILSQRLRQAADQHRAGGGGVDVKLSLQDLLRLHGESSLAVLLMLMAMGPGAVSVDAWWARRRGLRPHAAVA